MIEINAVRLRIRRLARDLRSLSCRDRPIRRAPSPLLPASLLRCSVPVTGGPPSDRHGGAEERRIGYETRRLHDGPRGMSRIEELEPRSGAAARVEQLQDLIDRLALERQRLRAAGAPARQLEANRRELVRSQWALSRALIHRYRAAEPQPRS